MVDESHTTEFKCKMGILRHFFRIPRNISVVATIKGKINENHLKLALRKLKKMHPLLGVKIVLDSNYEAWFSNENVPPIPLEIIERKSDQQWKEIIFNEHRVPFEFEKGPLIRFVLLKSEEISDLIVIGQHSICDGISLANLVRDALIFLSEPENGPIKSMEVVLPTVDNFPENTFLDKLKFFLKRIIITTRVNWKWRKQRITFDEEDYKNIHKAYTQKYQYKIVNSELSSEQTSALVAQCRRNQVTVNSALSVAFLAGHDVCGPSAYDNHRIDIAVNIRDRLKGSAKNAFGDSASNISLEFKYNPDKVFWDNVTSFHQKVLQELEDTKIFRPLVELNFIDPTLGDALVFATYGQWVTEEFSRYEKISSFSRNENNIAVKLSKQDRSNVPLLLMTNLGRLDYPLNYGSLKLDRLYFPPSSSPFFKVVGAVTVNGKLTLTLNYMETVDNQLLTAEMEDIMNKTIEKLNEALNDSSEKF